MVDGNGNLYMKETQCQFLNDYGVTLYVGGCGESGRWFRRQAHAHNSKKDDMYGSVCFLSARRLYNLDGSPSNTLKHELAHILSPNRGHSESWAATLRALGGKVATSYYTHLKK